MVTPATGAVDHARFTVCDLGEAHTWSSRMLGVRTIWRWQQGLTAGMPVHTFDA